MPKNQRTDASGNYAPALAAGGPVIPGGAFNALTNSIAKMFGLPTYTPGTNAFYGGRVGTPGTVPVPPTPPPQPQQQQPQAPQQQQQAQTSLPGGPQFDPSAAFNQPATPGILPALNTSGVNQYLSDPLMANYYRTHNPLYANQQQLDDFYGDPELFNAPSVMGAT
jgi:hypothetical protein